MLLRDLQVTRDRFLFLTQVFHTPSQDFKIIDGSIQVMAYYLCMFLGAVWLVMFAFFIINFYLAGLKAFSYSSKPALFLFL